MKKLLMAISIVLLLAMMPMALFGCDSDKNNGDTDANGEPVGSDDSSGSGTGEGSDTGSDTGKGTSTGKKTEASEKADQGPYEKVSKDWVLSLGKNGHADKVKKLGRTMTLTTGIACDHTASGIEFRGVFKGDVYVTIKSTQIKSNSPASFFTVYIDGVRQIVSNRNSVMGTKAIKVASFQTEGEHTIRVVKQTEANYTNAEFQKISFTGYLLTPPANKELYIEFIGDSLTCGMGNIGNNSSTEPQSAQWEDGTQSYGYMLAEELDADYSIISESGIGISGSWSDHDMPAYYPMTSYIRNKTQKYDFDRVPDLIVINLGTNDYYINKDKEPKGTLCTTAEVTEETAKFIKYVRDAYGEDVPIVWVSKFVYLSDAYVNAFEAGIMQYAATKLGGSCATVAAAEAAGIYRINVTQNTGGAQGHPTVAGHTTAKNEIKQFIYTKNIIK